MSEAELQCGQQHRIIDKGLIFIIYKELLQINREITNNPIDTRAKYKNRQIAGKSKVFGQWHMKMLLSLSIREIKMKAFSYLLKHRFKRLKMCFDLDLQEADPQEVFGYK